MPSASPLAVQASARPLTLKASPNPAIAGQQIMLSTSSAFATNLRAQWAFRPPQDSNPLAGYGPLAKSFEIALRSGESAL